MSFEPENCRAQNRDCSHKAASTIRLALLGCETKRPYGPIAHTTQLFADLLRLAASTGRVDCTFVIDSYNVQEGEYPTDWDAYGGFIIPGSFSSAYDTAPWIETLKTTIQNEIVAKQRKTLAVCFGHQVLAHSFETGAAVATPSGARAGRISMETTQAGQALFGSDSLELYFTHGDMVDALPPSATNLGGNDQVQIQAAAYYGSKSLPKPYAVSFQAHPEYATSILLGVERTLYECMEAMQSRGAIDGDFRQSAGQDAAETFERVQSVSLSAIVAVCRAFGWFAPGVE